MAQHNMRLQLTSGTSLTWVDPNDFRSTFRINLNVNQKVAGTVSVYNSRSEVITNRAPLVVIEGCTDACSVNRENISIRTTISGSVENKAAVLAALSITSTILVWLATIWSLVYYQLPFNLL